MSGSRERVIHKKVILKLVKSATWDTFNQGEYVLKYMNGSAYLELEVCVSPPCYPSKSPFHVELYENLIMLSISILKA